MIITVGNLIALLAEWDPNEEVAAKVITRADIDGMLRLNQIDPADIDHHRIFEFINDDLGALTSGGYLMDILDSAVEDAEMQARCQEESEVA